MRFYEHIFLARQDLSTSQVQGLIDHFKEIVTSSGAHVSKVENCGTRVLAQPRMRHRRAHYVLFNIESKPEAIDEMERQMRFHSDILLFQTVRVDKLDPEPSILFQTRSHRRWEGKGENREKKSEDMPKDEKKTSSDKETIRESRSDQKEDIS